MATFKPEDLTDAKPVTFSINDLHDAQPAASHADITRTSVPQVKDMARARLAIMGTTPQQVKANPVDLANQYHGPFEGETLGSMFTGPDKPAIGPDGQPLTFGGSFAHALNPMSWLQGPMDTAKRFVEHTANAFVPPEKQAPTTPFSVNDLNNVTGIPNIPGIADEARRRSEAGLSSADMYGPPAAMLASGLAGKVLPPMGRAILPPDIAAELATRAQRSSLGTEPKNFEHGATPDVATLQDPAGSVYRSQGRQIAGIRADKAAELNALENDMNAPQYKNAFSDPMKSVEPVLQEAESRAVPSEKTKIAEFRSLLQGKVRDLSSGSMQLNPAQIVALKRWVGGFIPAYKNETIGTTRDMAQNVYSAVRQHLEDVAPESAARGQRIQSLIEAEQAATKKMYTPMTEAKTTIGAVRNMFEPIVPGTLAKTGTAALLKQFSGGILDRPDLPSPLSPGFRGGNDGNGGGDLPPAKPFQSPGEPIKINLLKNRITGAPKFDSGMPGDEAIADAAAQRFEGKSASEHFQGQIEADQLRRTPQAAIDRESLPLDEFMKQRFPRAKLTEARSPEWTRSILSGADEGSPGFTVEEPPPWIKAEGIDRQLVYRGPDGKPIGVATIVDGELGEAPLIRDFAVDKSQGLLAGRAADAIAHELDRAGAFEHMKEISPDAARFVQKVEARRARAETAAPPRPTSPKPSKAVDAVPDVKVKVPFDPAARIAANKQKVLEADNIARTATPDEKGLPIEEIRKKRATQSPATAPSLPTAPTHITEGSQVSGPDASGNIFSGRLEKLYPKMGADGKPAWFGTVLDLKTGKTTDIPAANIFDKLKGPKD